MHGALCFAISVVTPYVMNLSQSFALVFLGSFAAQTSVIIWIQFNANKANRLGGGGRLKKAEKNSDYLFAAWGALIGIGIILSIDNRESLYYQGCPNGSAESDTQLTLTERQTFCKCISNEFKLDSDADPDKVASFCLAG